ncbi:MAG: DNA helicase RecQ [Candidatus Cloacimonetes bacterium]|nr:DNA helicase RecQ [Candidatus Cloacimonadota bacterium]
MHKKIYDLLASVFGYTEFRDLQEELIENILDGKDSLGIMPTGSGKSLCYQLPSLILPGMVIVVSPLISLMKDQVDQLRELGIKATFLNSSQDRWEYEETIAAILAGKFRLLYVAPETLLLERTLNVLQSLKISLITIDEAHCISEWGHDFRPEYRQLTILREKFPDSIILALTATATKQVRHDIAHILGIDPANIFISSFNRPNLFLEVDIKTDVLRQILDFIKKFPQQSGIIYCSTRKQVDTLTRELQQRNYSVLPYHAGLTDAQRWENQEKFSRDDALIMVATIAFGMGINKPNVRFIMHSDLPKNIETYYQQIGRAGRDGEPAQCLLLFNYGDIGKIKFFFQEKSEEELIHANNLLTEMIRYCEADVCRRVLLLKYFGETAAAEHCGNCDNCQLSEQELEDLTLPAQKFLSCMWRTGELYGANYIIQVLRGSRDQRILARHHEELSTYNIGNELSKNQWLELSGKLHSGGIIRREEEHGSLKLTPKAWDIMKNNEKLLGKLHQEHKPDKVETRDYDVELFEILRRERKRIADEKRVPPYVIFADKSLQDMAIYYPQTEASFLQMHGVGAAKCAAYAQVFLPLISDYAREKGKTEIFKGIRTLAKKRFEEVSEKFNQGLTVPALAIEYNVIEDTIVKHLERYVQEGNRLQRVPGKEDNFPTSEEVEDLMRLFHRLGTGFLKPVYDAYEGKAGYDLLTKVRLLMECISSR